MRKVRLVLVRHGESEWNAADIIQGHLGSDLSALGRDQAEVVSVTLRRRFGDASLIVSSDLERVTQTAEPYRRDTGLPVIVDALWREIDNGAWSGKTHAQVAEAFPEEFAAARRGEDIPRGGGETFAQLRRRVAGAVADRLAAAVADFTSANADRPAAVEDPHDPLLTAVVFTHGGPIRVAVAEVLGLLPSGHRQLQPPGNCSVTVVDYTVDVSGACRAALIVAYNETDHLPSGGHANATDDVAATQAAVSSG